MFTNYIQYRLSHFNNFTGFTQQFGKSCPIDNSNLNPKFKSGSIVMLSQNESGCFYQPRWDSRNLSLPTDTKPWSHKRYVHLDDYYVCLELRDEVKSILLLNYQVK